MNQKLVLRLLEAQGYTATIADNGREAVQRLEGEAFDLVLMDVEMPEMDGLTATREIRLRERFKGTRTPIVAVTTSDNRTECLSAGMDAFLEKPLSAQQLRKTLQRIMAA